MRHKVMSIAIVAVALALTVSFWLMSTGRIYISKSARMPMNDSGMNNVDRVFVGRGKRYIVYKNDVGYLIDFPSREVIILSKRGIIELGVALISKEANPAGVGLLKAEIYENITWTASRVQFTGLSNTPVVFDATQIP